MTVNRKQVESLPNDRLIAALRASGDSRRTDSIWARILEVGEVPARRRIVFIPYRHEVFAPGTLGYLGLCFYCPSICKRKAAFMVAKFAAGRAKGAASYRAYCKECKDVAQRREREQR